jgi:aspartate/methionine/tyrosine aminotransferase
MASFMEELLGGNMKVNAENIVITAGATAAIDILTFCIAEPGDALLIPSPYYPG